MRGFLVALLVVAACGDDGDINQLPDAPEFQDAPIDGATSGIVKLTIRIGTTPQSGVVVHFLNADSTVVASTMTDANGVAQTEMEPGGSVTAIDPFNVSQPTGVISHQIRTFAGVKPGDELVLGELEIEAPINFTLTVPVEPNASFYLLYAPCLFGGINVTDTDGSGGGPGPGGPLTLQGCGSTTDFTIVAHDGNGVPITSIHKANVALTEGGTVDLTADTYVATQDATWDYQNVPQNQGSLNVTDILATPRGQVFSAFGSALVTNSMASAEPQKRPVIANALQITSTTFFGAGFGRQVVLDWGPAAAAYTLVLGSLLNPNILVPDYSDVPNYDFPTHQVTWTVEASGQQPDFTVVSANFNRQVGITQFWTWEIAAPHATQAVTLPVLPGADATYNPIEGDSSNINELITARVPGGYDAIRETVHSLLQDPNGLVVGATGQVVFQELQRGKARSRPTTAARVLRPWVGIRGPQSLLKPAKSAR